MIDDPDPHVIWRAKSNNRNRPAMSRVWRGSVDLAAARRTVPGRERRGAAIAVGDHAAETC
jgi:hypothetical protein